MNQNVATHIICILYKTSRIRLRVLGQSATVTNCCQKRKSYGSYAKASFREFNLIRDMKFCFLGGAYRNRSYGLINRGIQLTCFPISQNVTFRDFTGLTEKSFYGVRTQVTGIAEKGQSEVKFWSTRR